MDFLELAGKSILIFRRGQPQERGVTHRPGCRPGGARASSMLCRTKRFLARATGNAWPSGGKRRPKPTLRRAVECQDRPRDSILDEESACRLEGRAPLCYNGELLLLGAYPSGTHMGNPGSRETGRHQRRRCSRPLGRGAAGGGAAVRRPGRADDPGLGDGVRSPWCSSLGRP